MSSILIENWFQDRSLVPSSDILFYPILEMIEDPTSEISLFFDTSLYCFALLLKVTNSFYTNFNNIPQLEFIMKISVISQISEALPNYNSTIRKNTETHESFKNEAQLQQENSLDSTRYGGNQLAPPVTSFAFFNYISSPKFLLILQKKAKSQNDTQVMDVLLYLINILQNFKCQLGVIVMPKIGSMTVSEYKKIYVKNLDTKHELFTRQIACVCQLVVFHKSFPFDLHSKNQLIDPTTMQITIIDYGRTVGLKPDEPNDEKYLTDDKREEIYKAISDTPGYESVFNRLSRSGQFMTSDPEKTIYKSIFGYMKELIEYILDIEIQGNIKRFGEDDTRMDFIWKVLEMDLNTKRDILLKSFFLIRESINVKDEFFDQETIENLVGNGRIIGFLGITPFQFYCDISQWKKCDENTGMCSIMGGARKKSKCKKKYLNNKTKKQKVKRKLKNKLRFRV